MSAYDRAKAAAAAAEAAQEAGDHRTAQAYRAAAATWERLSRPGVAWSNEPAWQQLKQLKRAFAAATGPFQPPAPPKAPPPGAVNRPDPARIQRQLEEIGTQMRREVTIEF